MKIPKHLQRETKRWVREVVDGYVLESHHLRLLFASASAWDRAEEARQVIDEKGMTYYDRFQQPRSRPECAIERDSRLAFARLLKQLELDVEPPRESPGRPPRTEGGY
jgi:hypothetical protein